MTQEQKEQLAREAAYGQEVSKRARDYDWDRGDTIKDGFQDGYYEGYLDAINARDEEVEQLKDENTTLLNQCENQRGFIAYLKAELEKAKNPWVSVKERLPEKMPKSDYSEVVFTRNKDGEVGKARYCHQGYMAPRWEHWLYGSGIPSPDYWMLIPKGGEK